MANITQNTKQEHSLLFMENAMELNLKYRLTVMATFSDRLRLMKVN